MPFCTTCGNYFDGRGSYCTIHNPWLQTYYNTSDALTDPSAIRYRTGYFGNRHNGYRKLRQVGFRDSLDALDIYNPPGSFARYDTRNNIINHVSDPITSPSTLRPLASTFTSLSHTNAITALTYSISPTGTRSVTATANPEREQCPTCLHFFPNRYKLDMHVLEYPVGCEAHGVCLREEDIGWHAAEWRHDRCFVRWCGSVYRREGGWKGTVIEGHVRGWHT